MATLHPWQQESELAMVRDWFFPQHVKWDPYEGGQFIDKRQQAVSKVNVWTFKSHKVPHAIVATADLTDSMLHYDLISQDPNQISYRAIQFMFAFAFMRFVNGFVDRDIARAATSTLVVDDVDEDDEQQHENMVKAAGESSMYAHAATIGMPVQFVDLRHQVSHGGLPELKQLKSSADQALNWLWERWWKVNATGDPGRALRAFEEKEQLRRRLKEDDIQRQMLQQGESDPTMPDI